MNLEVQYFDYDRFAGKSNPCGKPQLIEKPTEDEIFEEFYNRNNSLRYCNGSYWKFTNYDDDVRYHEWRRNLSQPRAFNLYYGKGGIVD